MMNVIYASYKTVTTDTGKSSPSLPRLPGTELSRLPLLTTAVFQILFTSNEIKPMPRVLVIESGMLLGAGIENLLQNEAQIEVIGIKNTTDEEIIQEIKHLHPDVIIFNETSPQIDLEKLLKLVKECPRLRILGVHPDQQVIRSFDQHRFVITQIGDLVGAIHRSHKSHQQEGGSGYE